MSKKKCHCGLRGTQITGTWGDKRRAGKGKVCKITAPASMHDVRECAEVCGSHFFDKGAMRFFNSRIGERAYADGKGGAYFVTSEKGPDGRRGYSVKRYDPKYCNFETIGRFQQYGTSDQAYAAIKRLSPQKF